jgi:hypothetical protein
VYEEVKKKATIIIKNFPRHWTGAKHKIYLKAIIELFPLSYVKTKQYNP